MSEKDILDFFEEEYDDGVRIVVAKYFYFESEARLYAARLKEAGIKSFISNANIATALPLGEGGIGLHVREPDLKEATRIIARLDYQKKLEPSDISFHDADLGDIEYQKALNAGKAKQADPVYLLVLLIVALLIARSFLRAAGIVDSWWDMF